MTLKKPKEEGVESEAKPPFVNPTSLKETNNCVKASSILSGRDLRRYGR